MGREDISSEVGMGLMLTAFAGWNGANAATVICELLDNALDASAKRVSITWGDGRFAIDDDGHGTDEAKRIVAPFNHGEHVGTKSGRYGFGGSGSLAWIAAALGRVAVESHTGEHRHNVSLDYGDCVKHNRLEIDNASRRSTRSPGTRIVVEGARLATAHQIGHARKRVAVDYAPALRAGVEIVINGETVAPFTPPEVAKRKAFRVEVDGCTVTGFCALVKPGKPNPIKGWAFAYGHRFIGTLLDPLGDLQTDVSRIYGEVVLPKSWKNINTTKDGFIEPPDELMAKVREASLWAIEQARAESQSIELSGAIAAAQGLLDNLMAPPQIERRDKPEESEEGTKEPKGTDRKRTPNKTQPDPKGRAFAGPRRIRLQWACDLGQPYQVRPMNSNTVFVLLDDSDPANRIYRGADAGPFLADIVLAWIAGDWSRRPGDYRPLFRDIEAESVAEMFAALRGKIQERTAAA